MKSPLHLISIALEPHHHHPSRLLAPHFPRWVPPGEYQGFAFLRRRAIRVITKPARPGTWNTGQRIRDCIVKRGWLEENVVQWEMSLFRDRLRDIRSTMTPPAWQPPAVASYRDPLGFYRSQGRNHIGMDIPITAAGPMPLESTSTVELS
jgi:hypothetical protein